MTTETMSDYWQEEDDDAPYVVPDEIVDMLFDMTCASLPVDHAQALAEALATRLPWLADAPGAALHLVHGAESGNGWERPEDGNERIYLSRRTKLTLRLPSSRVEQAATALSGAELTVADSRMRIGAGRTRLLSTHPAQYARYVRCEADQDENAFLAASVGVLRALDLRFKKVLCGKAHQFTIGGAPVTTRSLFVADLAPADAVRLQQHGIGAGRAFGFGVFIPHKTITK